MLRKLLIVLFIFSISILAFALDDQGNPNDPHSNERANACYEGGSMEGRCHTDWDWEAGWYMIRFDAGMISREDFPAQYAVLLPPLPSEESNSGSFVGCQSGPSNYINFGSSNFIPSGSPFYLDSGCMSPSGTTTGVPFVWANSQSQANSICAAHSFGAAGPVSGKLYHC